MPPRQVVPFQYSFLDGEAQHTYLYKANYNEYRPRKMEWYEGKADAFIDTQLVPNAVFHYDISPVMVQVPASPDGPAPPPSSSVLPFRLTPSPPSPSFTRAG